MKVEKQCYISGMAKLRPVDLLLLFQILLNRHLKASKNDKLEKKWPKNFCFPEIVIIKSVYVYSNSVQALNEK